MNTQHKSYPAHWGPAPKLQTKDLRQLPGGYVRGSGTLAKWIQDHLDEDRRNGVAETTVPQRIANARARQHAAPKDGARVEGGVESLRLANDGARPAAAGGAGDDSFLPEDRWPELLDLDGEEAKNRLLRCPGVAIVALVPEGAMVTMDYREERVRIFVDAAGRVAVPPRRG